MTENSLIVKSNRLIEASYRLTTNEQRLILFAIAKFREDKPDNTRKFKCVMKVKDYAETFGIADQHRNLYAQLKDASANLFSREVTIYETDPDTGKEHTIKTRWIDEVSTCDEIGYAHVIFNDRVIPYFHQLEKNFTSYTIKQIAKLNTPSAIRLYELLKQYETIGSRTIDLQDLRDQFQIADAYPTTYELKRRVIDPSIKQINKHTDLTVSYKDDKASRSITGFKFTIKSKSPDLAKPQIGESQQEFEKRKRKPRQASMRLKTEQPTSSQSEPPTPESIAIAKEALKAWKDKLNIKQ